VPVKYCKNNRNNKKVNKEQGKERFPKTAGAAVFHAANEVGGMQK
jgi:hypothetical protein